MAINLSKVSYTYNPHRRKQLNTYVLEDANISIETNGEFIAICGHTGSGKSTLIQLLNALLVPTIGEVDIDGNIITNKKAKNLKDIRKKVGLVFQFAEYQLFEESVLKDIAFGPLNFRMINPYEKAKEALKLVGLDESFLEKSPFKLSGGEMRKVAIAGILASNPDVLVLDEPTVGLDPFARKELIDLLKDINKQGKTVIIVTHDMEVVSKLAKRAIVLDESRIIFDGSINELFKNEELLKEHSLELPEIVSILKELKHRLNVDLDIYKYTVEDATEEIKRVLSYE